MTRQENFKANIENGFAEALETTRAYEISAKTVLKGCELTFNITEKIRWIA